MGGAYSRNKGKRGEREVIDMLQPIVNDVYDAHGLERVVLKRNTLQSDSGGEDVAGLHWLALEVKRHETLHVDKWWEQTLKQAGRDKVPVLLYRQNGKRVFHVCLLGRIGARCVRVTVTQEDFLVWFRMELHEQLSRGNS